MSLADIVQLRSLCFFFLFFLLFESVGLGDANARPMFHDAFISLTGHLSIHWFGPAFSGGVVDDLKEFFVNTFRYACIYI